jgi:hypothetical protein
VRLPRIDFVDDKAGKPVGIHRLIGKRPTAAFAVGGAVSSHVREAVVGAARLPTTIAGAAVPRIVDARSSAGERTERRPDGAFREHARRLRPAPHAALLPIESPQTSLCSSGRRLEPRTSFDPGKPPPSRHPGASEAARSAAPTAPQPASAGRVRDLTRRGCASRSAPFRRAEASSAAGPWARASQRSWRPSGRQPAT